MPINTAFSDSATSFDFYAKPAIDKNAPIEQKVPRKFHYLYNEVFPIIESSKFDDMGENQ